MDRTIIRQPVQLLADNTGIHRDGIVDVAGILDGQAAEHWQRMTAQCGNRLNVGLQAGPPGGVESGKDQNLGSGVEFDVSAPQKGLTTARITTITSTKTGNSLNQR